MAQLTGTRGIAIGGLVLAFVAVLSGSGAAQSRPSADVRFRWALALLPAGESVPRPVTGDVAIRAGDRIKLYVSPQSASFLYVLLEGPQDDLRVLFPDSFALPPAGLVKTGDYYAPGGNDWLTIPDVRGDHRIHVLASRQRLTRLEALVSEAAKVAPADRRRALDRVAAEIRSLKARHRRLDAWRTRPMPMGGAVRGDPAVKSMAREIEAREFFAATFVLARR
jgi:hypothetical protein